MGNLKKGGWKSRFLFMSKKEFERIVASIDERLDKDDIKGAYDTAYANRNDLFDYDAPYTITLLVQLAIEQVDFDLAEKTLEELENFPYVNQQTEETLRDMKKHIKDEMKSFYSRNRVKGYLPYSESLSDELISSYLQDKDFCNSPYAIPFAVSLVEDIKRDGKTKTGGLILLIERKYDKEVYLKKNGIIYKIVPKNTKMPFEDENFIKLDMAFQKMKDVSQGRICHSILISLSVALFPSDVFSLAKRESLEKAILQVSALCLRQEFAFSNEEEEELFKRVYELVFDECYSPKGDIPKS